MAQSARIIPTPPHLPATRQEMEQLRALKQEPTINDMVEQYYLQLIEDATFHKLIWAIHDSQAVEGSLEIDDTEAARMIRDKAIERGDTFVAGENLTTIRHALRVVLRRYKQSRKERRNMVGGIRVPDEEESVGIHEHVGDDE